MKVENMKTKLKIRPGVALFNLTTGIKLTLQPIQVTQSILFLIQPVIICVQQKKINSIVELTLL